MTLFAGLRRLRLLEAKHLPFVRSLVDFDLVVEIGYHEERGKPLTLKQLVAMRICSRTTIVRKLKTLTDQGIVVRVVHPRDKRVLVLGITSSAVQRLTRYSSGLAAAVVWFS